MYIAIHCAGMPFNGDTIPSGQSLGGSESAAYYMAKELVKLGHHVTVFTNHAHKNAQGDVVGQWWDGVLYEWLGTPSADYPLGDRFHMVMAAPFDVCIIQRHPHAFVRPVNAKLTIWWLHDLAMYRMAGVVQQHLVNIDKIFTVSNWHKAQVSKVYDIPAESIIATWNGVDYEMFEGLDENVREPRSLFYMARPERGLENLVGTDNPIMAMLPDCHLYVCGYNNTTPEMAEYYRYLWQRCEELPNVTNLGHLGKRQLYEAMSKAQLYVYPTVFEDTSCIAALEANAAGLPLIGSEWSAVPETMKDAGAVLLPLKNGAVDKQEFAKAVRRVLSQPTLYNTIQKKALAKRQTWESAAIQWDQVFRDELAKKSSDPVRLAVHFEQMSDIVAADKGDLTQYIKDFDKNYAFYKTGDYAGHYARYYEYEKNRGVNYGPENLQGNPRFEAVLGAVLGANPKTVLDFGCAHGHYVMNILARVPKGSMQITGIDIDKSNIEKAEAWANQAGLRDQTKFLQGSLEDLKARPDMTFDCILCSEVLEHVPNPNEYADELIKHLNPGGTFIGTTPYGPWEAIGYKDHPGWRAHLHHFERQDLIEMFGHMDGFKLMAVPWKDIFGHFVFMFSGTDQSRPIDYERKLAQQAPYETLSVCMIAYNEEYSIGRALKSIQDVADEIIVGIDEKTTDRTREVCEAFGAKCFTIKSPLEQGFDEARNRTIEQASMDWILWFDADETFENALNLGKYMKANCYNGYAIKQHHYAVEPPALFQTDLPVRLFRNHRGIRFFGFVHEHPEQEMNKGLGKIMVIEDAAIMHTGYSTELIRRGRFSRNWPLMQKDREKYPERLLGKFLWMRDLSHYNRYLFEQTGGRAITPEMMQNAQVAIDMWRELIQAKHLRMAIDGLIYYSHAVDLVTRGQGIKYCVDMAFSKLNGGAQLPARPIEGLFQNKKDIQDLTWLMMDTHTEHMEERYF